MLDKVCNVVLYEIFCHLDVRDLESVRECCSYLHSVGQEQPLWRKLLQQHFPTPATKLLDYKQRKNDDVINWRPEYQKSHVLRRAWHRGKYINTTETAHDSGIACVHVRSDNFHESRNPIILTGSFDRTAKLWKTSNGAVQCEKTFHGHRDTVWTVKSDSHNKIYTGSFDSTIRVWDIEHSSSTSPATAVLSGHDDRVLCMEVAEKVGLLFSASRQGQVKLWDTRVSSVVGSIDALSACVYSIKTANDNNLIYCGGTKDIEVYDRRAFSDQRPLVFYSGHTRAVTCLDTNESGTTLLSGSKDETLRVWDTKQEQTSIHHRRRPLMSVVAHFAALRSINFKGNIVVTSSNDHTVKVWRLESHSFLQLNSLYTIKSHSAQVSSCAVNNHQIVSGCMDGTVAVHDFSLPHFCTNTKTPYLMPTQTPVPSAAA